MAESNALSREDLEELLRPSLEAEGAKIKDFSVRYLTKPGDNYGSTMLAVDVHLTPGARTLPLVAKMLPKSAVLQELFQCEKTVRKEIDLYLLVRPAYERIQKENDAPQDKYLDVLPVCYGARTSAKDDAAPVDETSVILLENLKVQGFECGDRFVGFNLAHCKLIVDKLARFHATALALKIKKPGEFKKIMHRVVPTLIMNEADLESAKLLESIPEYKTLKERIDAAVVKSWDLLNDKNPAPPREPFATLTHIDFWTNNIMFQYKENASKENAESMKIVDFQIIQYDSPARDLLFFLYTSAELEVLSEHYDYLVRFYYDNFVDCLSVLRCDTTPFSFDEFLEDVKCASIPEFMHITSMLPIINLPKDDAKSTDNITYEDLFTILKVGKPYLDRASKFIQDFASRNWI